MQHFQNTQQHEITTHQNKIINQQSHMTPNEQPKNIQSPQMQHFQNSQMTNHQQKTINQQSHMAPHEQPTNIQSPQMQHFQNTQQHQMTNHQQRTINQQSHMTPHEQPKNIQSPQMQHFQNTQQHQMTIHQQRTINQQSHTTPHELPTNIQSPQMQHYQNTQQHQMTIHQQRTINQQSHTTPHEQPTNIQSPQKQHFQNTQQHLMTNHQQRTINQQSHMTPHEQPSNIMSPQMQSYYNFQNTQQSVHNISNRQLVQMTPHQDLPNSQSAYMTTHHNFPNNPTSPFTHSQQIHIPISEDFQMLQPSCDESMVMRQRQFSNSSQIVESQMRYCPPVCFAHTETSLSTLREPSHVSSSFIPPMESVQHNFYENGKPSNTTKNNYYLPLPSQVFHHANVLPERFTNWQQNANDLNRKQSTYLDDSNPSHMSKNLEQCPPMQSIQQNPLGNITLSAESPNHQQNLPSQTQQFFSTGTTSEQLTIRQQYANDLPRSYDTHPNKNASHMSENVSATGSPAMQYIPPSWPTSFQQPNYLNTVPTHDSRCQHHSSPVQVMPVMTADNNDKQRLQELNPNPTFAFWPEPPGCQPQLSTTPCWNSQYGHPDISYKTASYVGVSSRPQRHKEQFAFSQLPYGQQNSQSQSESSEGHIQQSWKQNVCHQYLNQQSDQLDVNHPPVSQTNGPYTEPHNYTVSYRSANNYYTEDLSSKQYNKLEDVQTQMSQKTAMNRRVLSVSKDDHRRWTLHSELQEGQALLRPVEKLPEIPRDYDRPSSSSDVSRIQEIPNPLIFSEISEALVRWENVKDSIDRDDLREILESDKLLAPFSKDLLTIRDPNVAKVLVSKGSVLKRKIELFMELTNKDDAFANTIREHIVVTKGETISVKSDEIKKTVVGDWDNYVEDGETLGLLHLMIKGRYVPTSSQVNMACRRFGRKSTIMKMVCEIICKLLQTSRDESVLATYKESDENCVTFLSSSYVHQELVSENKDVICKEVETKTKIDFDVMKRMKKTINKNSKILRKNHSNITMIAGSPYKSINYKEGKLTVEEENCIVILVPLKGYIPLQEDLFPKTLDEFKTDVREVVVKLHVGGHPCEMHTDLKMGCAIGPEREPAILGTLGGFVDHPKHGLCGLTCAHVLLNEEEIKKRPPIVDQGCIQPHVNGTHFGKLVEYCLRNDNNEKSGLDVALIKIVARQPVDGHFPDIQPLDLMKAGFNQSDVLKYTSGEICNDVSSYRDNRIVKYGAQTLLRRGVFGFDGSDFEYKGVKYFENVEFVIENQILIYDIAHCGPFSEPGDSGSLVFAVSGRELVPIGLLVGGGSGFTIMTPIHDVLRSIDCRGFKQFPNYLEAMETDER